MPQEKPFCPDKTLDKQLTAAQMLLTKMEGAGCMIAAAKAGAIDAHLVIPNIKRVGQCTPKTGCQMEQFVKDTAGIPGCPKWVCDRELSWEGQRELKKGDPDGCILAATHRGNLDNGVLVPEFDKRRKCGRSTGCLLMKELERRDKQDRKR